MATDSGDDRRLDGLMRDALRSQPAAGACLDAEQLAGWVDGGLRPAEARAVEEHLSQCASCRAMGAALTGITEEAGATGPRGTERGGTEVSPVVVAFEGRRRATWKVGLIAAGTIAASVLIWVAVRDESPAPQNTVADGRLGNTSEPSLPAPLSSPATGQAPQVTGAPAAPAEARSPARKPSREGEAGNARALEKPAAAGGQSRIAASPLPAAPPPSAQAVLPPPLPVAAPPPPPPPAISPTRTSTTAAATPPLTRVPVTIEPARNADVAKPAETFFATAPPPVIAEFIAGVVPPQAQLGQFRAADPAGAGGGGRGGGGAAGGRAGRGAGAATTSAAPSMDLAQPAVPIRWRLSGPLVPPRESNVNLVERSTDAGKTWQRVSLDADTPLLAAGSAPSQNACWLVGKEGRVLVSEDGVTFRRTSQPVSADLVFVQATDARTATVRTADGRTYVTRDGGASWTLQKE